MSLSIWHEDYVSVQQTDLLFFSLCEICDELMLFSQAVRIMELALRKYGNYEKFEKATGGSLLTKSRIWAHVKKYMEKEGCVGEVSEAQRG